MRINRKSKSILFLLVLLFTSLACNFALGNSGESGNQEEGVTLDYSSEFEDLDEWEIYLGYEEESYNLESTSNGLHISLVNPSDIAYGYIDAWYEDVSIESSVELADGEADITFELVCRSSEDGEYVFAFDLLGFYYVWIYEAEAQEYTEIDYGETDEINIESGKNTLSIDCIGENLDFYINGSLVASVEDDTFSAGFVGFAVETYDEFTAEVYFHYFDVYEE